MAKNKKKSAYRPRKKKIKHPVLLVIVLLLLALAALWGTKMLIDYITTPRQESENAKIEIVPTIRHNENAPAEPSAAESTPPENPEKTPTKSEGNNPNLSTGLTGSITYAAVADGKLIIRVNIDQLVGENGTCSLTLSKKGSKDIIKAVNTMDNPSSSTCQGFDIPLNEISKGSWNLKIDLSAGGKLGHIEGKVEV